MELEYLYDRYNSEPPFLKAHRPPDPWSFLYVDTDDGLVQSVEHTDEGVSAAVDLTAHKAAAEIGNVSHTATDKGAASASTAASAEEVHAVSSQMARCVSTLQTYFGGVNNVHVTRYESSSHVTSSSSTNTDSATTLSKKNEINAPNTNPHPNPNPRRTLDVNEAHHDVVLHALSCSDMQQLDTLLPRLWASMKPNNSLLVMVLSSRVDSSVSGNRGVISKSPSHTTATTATTGCFDAVINAATSTSTSTNTATATATITSATISTELIPLPAQSTLKCCPLDGAIGAKCVYFRYDR